MKNKNALYLIQSAACIIGVFLLLLLFPNPKALVVPTSTGEGSPRKQGGVISVSGGGKGGPILPVELDAVSLNSSATEKGNILYPQSGTEKILYFSPSGQVLHEWEVDSPRARLLQNCNLLALHGTKFGARQPRWKDLRNRIREYRPDGSIAWEYTASEVLHHDFQRLSSGNTLLLMRQYVPENYKRAHFPQQAHHLKIRADSVIEVDPQGEIMWRWDSWKHLPASSCGRNKCKYPRTKSAIFDWTHTNTVQVVPQNKWHKKGDTRFTPGNLILMFRNWSTAVIVDKKTKDIVWKYQGKLSGGHEPSMIPPGLPGAGNILLFDNGRKRNWSQVIEIEPPTKKIVWSFENGNKFFSKAAGSAQRLPGGNTLISEDVRGNIFEVAADGTTVWRYENPHRGARARKYKPKKCMSIFQQF